MSTLNAEVQAESERRAAMLEVELRKSAADHSQQIARLTEKIGELRQQVMNLAEGKPQLAGIGDESQEIAELNELSESRGHRIDWLQGRNTALQHDLNQQARKIEQLEADNTTLKGCVERLNAGPVVVERFLGGSNADSWQAETYRARASERRMQGELRAAKLEAGQAVERYRTAKLGEMAARHVDRLRRRLRAFDPLLGRLRAFAEQFEGAEGMLTQSDYDIIQAYKRAINPHIESQPPPTIRERAAAALHAFIRGER